MPAGAPPQHSPVWPLWMRPSPIPKRRFMILPKTRKSVGSHRHHVPVFHAVSVPHTGGRRPIHKRPPIRISRPPAIHKKPQSPQSRISQAMHCSPCLAASRTPRIPIRAISPYRHSLTMCPPRPARPVPQTRRQPVSSNSLRLLRRAARRRRQRMASLRDATTASASQWRPALKPARRPAPAVQGADPRGIWTGWTRQKSAGAASGQSDPQNE